MSAPGNAGKQGNAGQPMLPARSDVGPGLGNRDFVDESGMRRGGPPIGFPGYMNPLDNSINTAKPGGMAGARPRGQGAGKK